MACPRGLTQEQLLAAPTQLLGLGGVCFAFDADGNHCGGRLSDHPHAPPGKNILLFEYNFYSLKN
jgi:hypothetical protein